MPRVLVVDDNEDILFLIEVILSSRFEVVTRPDGTSALSLLAQDRSFDAVVLDVQMPGVDGWAILERIRKDPLLSGLPVVLCTVKSSEEDRRRAASLGTTHYLSKPFEPRALLDVLDQLSLGRTSVRTAPR